jgi:hypothetical protein
MRRKDEKPPENHWKKRFPELEKELLDTYYKVQGLEQRWDPDSGIPAWVGVGLRGRDFLERGILTDAEDAPSQVASTGPELK